MRLLKDEVKLDTLTDSIVLTNQRIVNERGNKYKNSIFLEKISSIEMHYKNQLAFLISGIIVCIIGIIPLFDDQSGAGLPLLLIGIVLITAFFLTRKHVIIVYPDGGKSFEFGVKGASPDRIDEFLTNVRAAILDKNSEDGL